VQSLNLVPLSIIEIKPGLHERAEGITHKPVYRLSWPKKPIRLFGRWRVPGTETGSGNYIKTPVEKLNILPEANRRYRLIKNTDEVQEITAFIDTQLTGTRINAILAARIAADWFELYRWNSSWRQLGLSGVSVRDE